MENKIEKVPRVFISYAWSTDEKFEKVLLLASRLRHDGIDAILDRWCLNHGQDKYAFMESMVRDKTIDRVLIMSDSIYAKKADAREGGAGTESQIICDELYNDVESRKFIPIILEREENGKECLPIYLKSRIYIDFSDVSKFEESYEELLRDLHNRPSLKMPPIGKPPSYLFEEDSDTIKTSMLESQSLNRISVNPKKSNEILKEFIAAFEKELEDYHIKYENQNGNLEERIYKSIIDYIPQRNKFIKVLDNVLREGIELDIDIIIRFFENQPRYYHPIHTNTWTSGEFDGFKFITRELFLYVISLLLRHECYEKVTDLLYSKYTMFDKYGHYDKPCDFDIFNVYLHSIENYYNGIKGANYISCMAHIMIENICDIVERKYLVEADVLCSYIAEIKGINWTPWLHIYREGSTGETISRLYSRRHFEKVKCLFNVDNKTEFISMINKLKESNKEANRYFHSWRLPLLCEDVNIDNICISR